MKMSKLEETSKNNVGENIKRYRKLRKMKQIDLSKKTGITQNNISRYENGKVSPTMAVVMKIAEALGVDLSELVDFSISDETRNEMNKQSFRTSEAFKKKLSLMKLIFLEDKNLELQKKIDVLLSENQIDGEAIRILMKEKNILEKELLDLKIQTSKDLSDQNIGKESKIDNSSLFLYCDIATLSENLEFLFNNSEINIMYEESAVFNETFKRIFSIGIDNFELLFPLKERKIWKDVFEIIKSIKKYLNDSDSSPKTAEKLIKSISNFYSRPEIGIDPKIIEEKFSKLLNN